jgi:hypothetical protein
MHFITHSGVAINLDLISFIDFRQEGKATVHSFGQSFLFDGDDAASLLKRFPPAPAPKPVAVRSPPLDPPAPPPVPDAPAAEQPATE